jgi:uncharacterized protein YbjT (DUF2867 family)
MNMYRAIIVGASGLIGSKLLTKLIESNEISGILSISRTELSLSDPKLTQLVLNFDDLAMYAREIKGDIIYSCLGTTKTQTPDPVLYRKIDYEYPLQIAGMGLKNDVSQIHIVTSLGANPGSSNSYLKLKGELEEKLIALKYKSVHIYQPSFLTGKREKPRILEGILNPVMRLIDPILVGPLKKYRSIEAETVANAMFNQSLKDLSGHFIYPSIEIQNLA